MKVISSEAAAGLIQDGQVISVSGLAGNLVAERVLEDLERRFLETGHPRGLTEIHPWLYGSDDGTGLNRWAHPGFLKRTIGSTFILPSQSKTSEMTKFVYEDGLECYIWPANAIFQMHRAAGARRSGFLTDVGIGTYADPRVQGGKINPSAKDDLIRVIEIDGQEQLYYPTIPIDVALIKASTADTDGNLSCEEEGLTQGIQVQATAAKNSGGIVIAQVKRIVDPGTVHPMMIEVPGVMVDYVVVHEGGLQFENGGNKGNNEATTGAYRKTPPVPEFWPHDFDKIIARRAIMEVKRNDLLNIGGGIPIATMPSVAFEEDLFDKIRWSVEHGVFGGIPMGGMMWNPNAILSPAWLLDFYNGGGLDVSALGFVQVDRFGNTNVGKYADQLPGPGGYTDIAHATPRLLFCGTMTAGGLEVNAEDGRLEIVREGCERKFVRDVEMICFSGQQGHKKGQDVLYITERAVFRLGADGLVLEEVAPGIDVEKQVLALADFPIAVSPDLKLMDDRLFRLEPLFLGLQR